jgi:hypothetical protein
MKYFEADDDSYVIMESNFQAPEHWEILLNSWLNTKVYYTKKLYTSSNFVTKMVTNIKIEYD